MLGETTASGFEQGLDALLNDVDSPGRTVVMLELPLPPTFNRFGMIQRRLASKHHVVLVPKRVLMGVLARGDATLDSIHLSQSGHQRLADAVWNIIEPK
jgi:acyl-CoA thioesterase-1